MKKNLFTALLIILVSMSYGQDKVFAPTLVSPADAAINQMATQLLDWSAVAGAQSYQLQYDTDNTFTNPINTFTGFSAAYTGYLDFNETYFWRVRAIGNPSDTSAWSLTNSFTVKEKPVLVLPLSGLTNHHLLPKVKWQPITGCEFHVEYDTLSDFSSPFLKTITEVTDSLTSNLGVFGEEVFIRVRAFHVNDTSDWSDVVSLTTREELPLKAPVSGIQNVTPIVQLEFKGIVGSSFYQYEYSPLSDFSVSTIVDVPYSNQTILSGSFPDTVVRVFQADTLAYGAILYWRARAISAEDTTLWSSTPFTVEVVADVQTLYAPASAATGVSTKPIFKWKKIQGSRGYDLEYSKDPTFATDVTAIEVNHPTVTHDTVMYAVPAQGLDTSATYYWRVRAFHNRAASDWLEESFTTEDVFASTGEIALASALTIYPNPTKGKINVQIHSAISGDYNIRITNLIGQTVITKSGSLTSGKNTIAFNLDELTNGFYFISVEVGKQSVMHKIILDK
jgi:hypothetical protein